MGTGAPGKARLSSNPGVSFGRGLRRDALPAIVRAAVDKLSHQLVDILETCLCRGSNDDPYVLWTHVDAKK
jgi:hypothetical protein